MLEVDSIRNVFLNSSLSNVTPVNASILLVIFARLARKKPPILGNVTM